MPAFWLFDGDNRSLMPVVWLFDGASRNLMPAPWLFDGVSRRQSQSRSRSNSSTDSCCLLRSTQCRWCLSIAAPSYPHPINNKQTHLNFISAIFTGSHQGSQVIPLHSLGYPGAVRWQPSWNPSLLLREIMLCVCGLTQNKVKTMISRLGNKQLNKDTHCIS